MASRFSGTPVSFFIYSSPSPSPSQEEEEQQIGSPKSPVSVIPVSFFSSREQQIGTPFTPHNAPKIMNPNLSISPISSADRFRFRVPYTTDDAVVLQNLIHIIHSVINRDKMKSNSNSKSLSLTPAQRLFNSLDLVQKKVAQQLDRIKETPTFQMGYRGERRGLGEYFSMEQLKSVKETPTFQYGERKKIQTLMSLC